MVGGGQGLDFSPVGFELLRDACEGMIQAAGSGVRGKVSAADRKLGVTGSGWWLKPRERMGSLGKGGVEKTPRTDPAEGHCLRK